MRNKTLLVISAITMVLALVGCVPSQDAQLAAPFGSSELHGSSDGATAEEGAIAEQSVPAVTLLEGLEVKGRAPKTGYDRQQFGQRWSDDVTVDGGHNGCDTRNDILRRDLVDLEFKPGTRDCVVLRGILHDPYTGKDIPFARGQGSSEAVQIDHVVSMSNAWQTGAQQLSPEERANFANDPLNLLAVDGPANQNKGSGDAATWLPPVKNFRCAYVSRQIEVKARYRLWVTQPEKDAMLAVLSRC